MPIDPNIALNLKPVQLANPLEQYGQFQQAQSAMNQNRLADLIYGEKQRDSEQNIQLNNVYKSAVGADGTVDRNKLYTGVAAGGLGSKLPSIQKSFADADKLSADVEETKAKTLKAKAETTGLTDKQREEKRQKAIVDIAGFQTPQEALSNLELHEKSGDLTPESAAAVRATIPQNPADFPKWQIGMLQRIMSAGDAMKQLAPDANTVANNTTSRANNAATNATTQRGQNMTDARARENLKGGQYDAARGVLVDTRTGTASAVTGPDGKPLTRDKAMTEFQGKSAAFGDRAAAANQIITGLEGKYSPAAINSKNTVENTWLVGGALGAATNKLALSESDQRAEQAQRDFVNAVLRQESGAAIGASEFDNARKQYFPQPGDGTAVRAQKAANRKLAVEGLQRNAGSNYQPATAKTAQASAGDHPPEIEALLDKYK